MATVGKMTAPPISVDVGKLDSAVSPEKPMTDVVEEPTTATWILTDEVGTPAAANEDSTALLTWLTSTFNAPVGDVAAIKAVTALIPPDSKLPVCTEAVADETTLASMPMIAEPKLLCTSVGTTLGTVVETDSWPTLPPKGDSEMNVGVELSFLEDAPALPKKTLTL